MEKKQDFHKMTFSQREGKVPLHDQMQTEHISSKFRRLIWKYIDKEIRENTTSPKGYLGDFYIEGAHIGFIVSEYKFDICDMPHDEIEIDAEEDSEFLREIILKGAYHELLTLIEYFLRHEFLRNEECMGDLRRSLIGAFDEAPIAYSVVEFNKPTIVPRSSAKAGRAAQRAIEKIREADMDSAETHLYKATDLLRAREYADSIRESIHAVESVACAIDPQPEAKNNLSKALNSLENNGLLKHADIKEACRKLYDFTNKVRGIRHAREARKPPDVGLDEAEFMLGACSFFVDYLTSRQQAEKQGATADVST